MFVFDKNKIRSYTKNKDEHKVHEFEVKCKN